MSFLSRLSRALLVGRSQDFVFRRPHPGRVASTACGKVGLYIHIPFCKSLCPYCPYYKVPYRSALAREYTGALLAEIEQYHARFGRIEITSIYIGGGTPTLLLDELETVLGRVRERFNVTGETCLETSPADLSCKTIEKLKRQGIDLLSVGVQSFDEKNLRFLGRKYDRASVTAAIERAMSAGFASVNLDLIFALPGQKPVELKEDLNQALASGADQITLYPLFTFPYTAVGRHLGLSKTRMPQLFERRRLYQTLHEHCEAAGLERTSVWGFKRRGVPRYSSVTRDRFLGLGAAAGSHLPGLFHFNTFDVGEYTRTCLEGKLPVAFEMKIDPTLEAVYWLYWRLYDTAVTRAELAERMGPDRGRYLDTAIDALETLGFCRQQDGGLSLTERGAFWIHLLQNQYVLGYIDKVWTTAMSDPWPEAIAI